jgi:ATP-dependent phosphoenolpyruvate carboxykinase
VTATGAFAVVTGTHTGRSAADKSIVRDHGDNAKALTPEQFDNLLDHASHKNLFGQKGDYDAPARGLVSRKILKVQAHVGPDVR